MQSIDVICIGYGYDVLLVRSDNVQEYSGVEGIYSDTAFDHDQLNPWSTGFFFSN